MSTKQDNSITKVALLGAAGRMGRMLMDTARDYPGVRISAALVRASSPLLDQDAGGFLYTSGLEHALAESDVLMDFSAPTSTAAAMDACLTARKPFITGVTHLDAELQNSLLLASRTIAVLAAPNMSLGANLLLQLVRTAAASLGEEFDIEITDAHHRSKKDAPSGTALALGEAVASSRKVPLGAHAVYERQSRREARRAGSIGFSSIRGGDIVGDHTVIFAGPAERLELIHRAQSRAAFARGALTAARWIAGQPAGLYSMSDVLGIASQRS